MLQQLSKSERDKQDPAKWPETMHAEKLLQTLQSAGAFSAEPSELERTEPFVDTQTCWKSEAAGIYRSCDAKGTDQIEAWDTGLKKQDSELQRDSLSKATLQKLALNMGEHDQDAMRPDTENVNTWEEAATLGGIVMANPSPGFSLAHTVATGAPDASAKTPFGKPLNSEQARVVVSIIDHTMRRLQGEELPALRSVVLGEPGVGKSVVIAAVRRHFVSWGLGDIVAVAAYTGKAACIVNGCTLHKLKGGRRKKDLSGTSEAVKKMWRGVKLLFIDEFSMVSLSMLGELALKAMSATGASEPFGDINVAMIGDQHQFEVVAGKCLFHDSDSYQRLRNSDAEAASNLLEHRRTKDCGNFVGNALKTHTRQERHLERIAHAASAAVTQFKLEKVDGKGKNYMLGFELWHDSFTNVHVLEKQVRCADDPEWHNFLKRVRHCYSADELAEQGLGGGVAEIMAKDHAMLSKMVLGNEDRHAREQRWQNAIIITPRNATRMAIGKRRLQALAKRTGQREMVYHAWKHDTTSRGTTVQSVSPHFARICKATNDKEFGCMAELLLVIGGRYQTTENRYTALNHTNGSTGTLAAVLLHPDEPPERSNLGPGEPRVLRFAPTVLLKMDDPKFKKLPGLEEGILPIKPQHRTADVKIPDGLKDLLRSAKGKPQAKIRVRRYNTEIIQAAAIGNMISQGSTYPDRVTPGLISDQAIPRGIVSMQDMYIPLSRGRTAADVALLSAFEIKALQRLRYKKGVKYSTAVSPDLLADVKRLKQCAVIEAGRFDVRIAESNAEHMRNAMDAAC